MNDQRILQSDCTRVFWQGLANNNFARFLVLGESYSNNSIWQSGTVGTTLMKQFGSTQLMLAHWQLQQKETLWSPPWAKPLWLFLASEMV